MKLKRIAAISVLAATALLLIAGKVSDITYFMRPVHFVNSDAGHMTFASNCVTEAVDSGSATQSIPGVFPARVLPLGVSCIVDVGIAGEDLTTWSLGDGTDADLYGAALSPAGGTTVGTANYTARPTTQAWSTSAGNLTMTAGAGQFDSGTITCCGHYVTFHAPVTTSVPAPTPTPSPTPTP